MIAEKGTEGLERRQKFSKGLEHLVRSIEKVEQCHQLGDLYNLGAWLAGVGDWVRILQLEYVTTADNLLDMDVIRGADESIYFAIKRVRERAQEWKL